MRSSPTDSSIIAAGKAVMSPDFVFDAAKLLTRQAVGYILPPPQDCHDHGSNKGTVLVIPGLFTTPSGIAPLGESLKEHMNVVYAKQLPWLNRDIHALSRLVSREITKALHSEKNGDLTILAHSTGGVLAVLAVANSTSIAVNGIITMATPHAGSNVAGAIRLLPVGRDLAKGKLYRHMPDPNGRIGYLRSHIALQDSLVASEHQSSKHIPISSNKQDILHEEKNHLDFLEPEFAQEIVHQLPGKRPRKRS